MNRKQFLHGLRRHLTFLEKSDMEKVILDYINKIDSSNKPDEEIIKNFGSFKDIQKEVAEKYGKDVKTSIKKEMCFQKFYKNIIKLGTILKKSDSKKRGQLFWDLLLLIIITCVLKIPFLFIRDIGDRAIENFFTNNLPFLAIWGLIVELLYIIGAILFFIKTFDKWLKKMDY